MTFIGISAYNLCIILNLLDGCKQQGVSFGTMQHSIITLNN